MSHVFYRHLRQSYPTAVRGDGVHVVDSNGKRYLDASGGAAVSCLGHSHPAVIDAIKRQLDSLAYAHTGFFTSEPAEALADRLIATAPAGMDKVYFVSGGSEAVEAALKLARQYYLEIGEPGRRRFIARRQSYHGNTLGALAVGGNAWRRQQFEPILIDADHLTPCYAYREKRSDESEEAFGQRLAAELETHLRADRPRDGHRLHRRAGGGCHAGRRARRSRLLPGDQGGPRPARHPAHPGRGDVRHGPHRHALRLRGRRRRPRHDLRRQGAGRGLPADRCHAGARADRRARSATAAASSSTATPTWATPPPAPPASPCSA